MKSEITKDMATRLVNKAKTLHAVKSIKVGTGKNQKTIRKK